MATVDDFALPAITFSEEASPPADPPAGAQRLYVDGNGDLWLVDSTGAARPVAPFGDLSGAADGDSLVFDAVSGLWVPGAGGGGGGSTGDAAWTDATYAGTWTSYGAPYATAGYRKDGQGFVHLRGLIKNGTINTAAFVLPAGYRPGYKANHLQWTSTVTAAVGVLEVRTTGDVVPVSGNNTYFSLDGVSFYAEA